tara:strand:+ start:99 stop:947 length:849 start_codon:yes stop_codon:yes gene_type:complete
MSILLHGDCLEELKGVDDDSVDLVFCDLPYGQTGCKWDTPIDLDKFWVEIMRVKKLHTPVFMTCTTKFGASLITSAPKKCQFRYDLVWIKSCPCGFLSAKKMPMRKHEMIYVFYEKLPFYDLSSHKHKFLDKEVAVDVKDSTYGSLKIKPPKTSGSRYDPALPDSVVKEEIATVGQTYGDEERDLGQYKDCGKKGKNQVLYDPPLPVSMIEIKTVRKNHSTEKPVALMEWIFKYYSKEGDVVLDPTMGSGSTGVACKNMNRNFIGIEMDAEIYEIAVNRIDD